MFAQSLAEYGALASITAAARNAADSAQAWVEGRSQGTWIVTAAVVFAALILWRRRASRL